MNIIHFDPKQARKKLFQSIYSLPLILIPILTFVIIVQTSQIDNTYIMPLVLWPLMTWFFYSRNNSILTQISWNETFVEVSYVTRLLQLKKERLDLNYIDKIKYTKRNVRKDAAPILEIKPVGKKSIIFTLMDHESNHQLEQLIKR